MFPVRGGKPHPSAHVHGAAKKPHVGHAVLHPEQRCVLAQEALPIHRRHRSQPTPCPFICFGSAVLLKKAYN